MRDVATILKSKGFSVLASLLLTITSFLCYSIYSDVKYLVAKSNQYDVRLDNLEQDVNRLNNKVFYKVSVLMDWDTELSPSEPPTSKITRIKDPFVLPSLIELPRPTDKSKNPTA